MTRYRSPEEIRRFDLMKLGVLLLLIVLLILTWILTRDNGPLDLVGEPEATAVAEGTAAADGLTREPGTVVAPTLAPLAINPPTDALPIDGLTLSGVAGPGAQVQVLADGQPLGLASAGTDGVWSLTAALPAGPHVLVAQTLDNVGGVVAESAPLTITVGEAPIASSQITFQPLSDAWSLAGVAAPGTTVTILSGGAVLGETTADDTGAWSLALPAAGLGGELAIQSTDAAGALVTTTVAVGPRPPSITAPGQIATAPDGRGLLIVPVGVAAWTGRATPGTQVEVVVDGQSTGVATVDDGGNWSLPVDLPAGSHTVQINSLDAAGVLLAAGPSLAVASETAIVEGSGTPIAEATAVAETTPDAETTPATEPAADTLLAALQGRPELSTLLAAADAAGLAETLAGPAALTVFAPTNDAFAALPQSAVDTLLANPEALAALLRYHVARGRYTAADLRIVQPATLDGRLLTIAPQGDSITVNGATVLAADVAAGNGLIHVVDRILLPPLAAGVRPPVIDESGVPTFVGPRLTVVGTAEPGRAVRVEIDGQAFGEATIVDAGGNWSVSGDVAAGEHQIVAFMLNGATLEAFSRPVALVVR
ncbi:MAG: fasciclin domain-containing protein [Candidatus Promineofilum sp.]|jgi:uncharacterized surface protein with fasciclin (FAS1) repeats|nr:fasciclin domain-containing protein [Promineifilum sp.]